MPCTWTEDSDGNWTTECAQMFVLTDEAGPLLHGMRWCCYCGQPLNEQRYAVPEPELDEESA